MKTNKIEHTKKELITALTKSLGVVQTACKIVKISRTTFYQYLKDDNQFAKAVKDIEDIALDYTESKLFELIQEKNVPSVLFYLKTKGKKRGYIERTDIDLTTKGESLNTKTDLSKLTDAELQNLKKLNEKCNS